MYYIVYRLQPAIFDDYFKFVTSVSRHRLRSVNDDKLYLPFFKNKSGQNSINLKGFFKNNVLRKLIISYRQYTEFYRHNQTYD